ncbi:MAG: hypothetical protein ACI9EK_000506, partial [Psychroserpens sp.]
MYLCFVKSDEKIIKMIHFFEDVKKNTFAVQTQEQISTQNIDKLQWL